MTTLRFGDVCPSFYFYMIASRKIWLTYFKKDSVCFRRTECTQLQSQWWSSVWCSIFPLFCFLIPKIMTQWIMQIHSKTYLCVGGVFFAFFAFSLFSKVSSMISLIIFTAVSRPHHLQNMWSRVLCLFCWPDQSQAGWTPRRLSAPKPVWRRTLPPGTQFGESKSEGHSKKRMIGPMNLQINHFFQPKPVQQKATEKQISICAAFGFSIIDCMVSILLVVATFEEISAQSMLLEVGICRCLRKCRKTANTVETGHCRYTLIKIQTASSTRAEQETRCNSTPFSFWFLAQALCLQ